MTESSDFVASVAISTDCAGILSISTLFTGRIHRTLIITVFMRQRIGICIHIGISTSCNALALKCVLVWCRLCNLICVRRTHWLLVSTSLAPGCRASGCRGPTCRGYICRSPVCRGSICLRTACRSSTCLGTACRDSISLNAVASSRSVLTFRFLSLGFLSFACCIIRRILFISLL